MEDRDRRGGADAYPGAPLWVKLFVAALIAIVVVFILATVFGLHTPMPHGAEATPHPR